MFKRILLAATAAIALSTSAHAVQFQAEGGIFNGVDHGTSYAGAGGTTPLYNQALGAVFDGSHGAFDAFGFYNAGVGSLTQSRQVDLLSGNVYRFFDTFTNDTGATITTTLNFFGNLGSDGDELISFSSGGLIVSCEDDGAGACGGGDPVLALVSGNNGLGQASITPDRYNVSFSVTLQAGQSLSLLNFAFLASDVDGPSAADVLLAKTTGQALLNAPRLDGLTPAQIGSIANFNITPVPEASSWAMLVAGLVVVGVLRARGRRSAAVAA
jgi:hypothetical protein